MAVRLPNGPSPRQPAPAFCVPSVPFPLPLPPPISLYSSIYPPTRATPLGTLRAPQESPPSAFDRRGGSTAKGLFCRNLDPVVGGCLGYSATQPPLKSPRLSWNSLGTMGNLCSEDTGRSRCLILIAILSVLI